MNIPMWRRSDFRAYLANTGSAGLALGMQQLLLSWILVGILELPADQVGTLQALIGVPAVFLMLWGGVRTDATDPRQLLLGVYFVAPLFPLLLLLLNGLDLFTIWSVALWAFGLSTVQALSTPAQQAILNRVAGSQVQQAVTASTGILYIVQIAGLLLASQLDQLGLSVVLLAQAMSFLAAGIAVRWIAAAPATGSSSSGTHSSPLQQIREGFVATLEHGVIRSVLVINFFSTIFNAGSFLTTFPFIVKRIYDGDAQALGLLMALFFVGAALANMIQLRLMPLERPGRVYLLAQLSRVVVLVLLYISESWWLLMLATFLWGMNMGVTTNLARTIVQESAPAAYRGRILSVFAVGMLGTAPLGALILGWLIETFGTLDSLLPAMLISLLATVYGLLLTPIWGYRSSNSSA